MHLAIQALGHILTLWVLRIIEILFFAGSLRCQFQQISIIEIQLPLCINSPKRLRQPCILAHLSTACDAQRPEAPIRQHRLNRVILSRLHNTRILNAHLQLVNILPKHRYLLPSPFSLLLNKMLIATSFTHGKWLNTQIDSVDNIHLLSEILLVSQSYLLKDWLILSLNLIFSLLNVHQVFLHFIYFLALGLFSKKFSRLLLVVCCLFLQLLFEDVQFEIGFEQLWSCFQQFLLSLLVLTLEEVRLLPVLLLRWSFKSGIWFRRMSRTQLFSAHLFQTLWAPVAVSAAVVILVCFRPAPGFGVVVPRFQRFSWASTLGRLQWRTQFALVLFLFQDRVQPVMLALDRVWSINSLAWRERSRIGGSSLCSQMLHGSSILFLHRRRIWLDLVDLWILSPMVCPLDLLDCRVALLFLREPVLLNIGCLIAAHRSQLRLWISWSGAFRSWSWLFFDLSRIFFPLWIFASQWTSFEFKISNIQRLALDAKAPTIAWHLQR